MKFNADLGSPAPGFRLGLPTLQQRCFNPQTGSYAYMMVTPSGGRVEFAAGGHFEYLRVAGQQLHAVGCE